MLVVINLLVKMVYLFLVEVNVQNTLGLKEYGLFLALFNFSYLFQFINDPGIHVYNITQIKGDLQQLRYFLPRIIGSKIILGIIFLVIVYLSALFIGYEMHTVGLFLVIIAGNHILSTFFLYLRSNLSILGRYRQDSILSVIDKLVMIFLIGSMLLHYGDQLQLLHFVIGQTISYTVAIMITLLVINKNISLPLPKCSLTFIIKLLKQSMPYALVLLLMASYNKMDGVMLERLLPNGAYQAGVYATSLRYMEASNMVAYLFAALLLPMFSNQNTSQQDILELCDTGLRLMSVVVITICCIGIIFQKELMSIYKVYEDQYRILLIYHLSSFGCIGISYIYGTLLMAKRKIKKLNFLFFLGVILNFGLNLYLIPRQLAAGSALATFITQFTVMVGQLFLAFRIFHLHVKWSLIGKILLLILLSIFISQSFHQYILVHWVISAMFAAVLIGISATLLRIIEKDMIFALLSERRKSNK